MIGSSIALIKFTVLKPNSLVLSPSLSRVGGYKCDIISDSEVDIISPGL